MTDTLLLTKLYPPTPQPTVVTRPRLLAQLDQSQFRKLTLISAPAGFGKTTLLGAWLAKRPEPVAWLSLDGDDDDPAQFVAYLIAALQRLDPALGQAAQTLLTAPDAPAMEIMLSLLLNDLLRVPSSAFLILDDYHLLQDPAIHAGMDFLIEHLPPQLHIVIVSRTEPPLSLARLRAKNQLLELSAAELRFSETEATAFFQQVMDIALRPAEVARLDRQMEGWVTGLQLVGLSLRGQPDVSAFLKNFSGRDRYITDYLIEEIFQQQPEAIRTFLLRTAILERLSAPLCAAVTDQPDAQHLLETVARKRLFLTPLDNSRTWYRYHPIFGEVLRQRLQETEPERLPRLHQRAARWYRAQGLTSPAIRHLLAAREFEAAADLIAEVADRMWLRGEMANLLRWLEEVPPAILRQHLKLGIIRAVTLSLTGQQAEAQTQLAALATDLNQVFALERLPPGSDGEMYGLAAILKVSFYLEQRQIDRAMPLARRALAWLTDTSGGPLKWGGVGWLGLSNVYRVMGEGEQAIAAMKQAARLALEADFIYLAIGAFSSLAKLYLEAARLDEAAETCRQALALTGEQPLPVQGVAEIILGQTHYERGQLARARPHLRRGLELVSQDKDAEYLLDGYFTLALSQARPQDAEAIWQKATGHLDSLTLSSPLEERRAAYHAYLRLAAGKLGELARWAEQAQLYQPQDELKQLFRQRAAVYRNARHAPGYTAAFIRLTLAWWHITRRQAEAALTTLAQLSPDDLLPKQQLEWHLLRALAYHSARDSQAALTDVSAALRLAQTGGLLQPFLIKGAALRPLLEQAEPLPDADPAFIERLLATLPAAPATDLTERELEVLRHLARGLTYAAAAEQLHVTENTIRTHIKNIYGKLGVNNRTQAINRAKARGVI